MLLLMMIGVAAAAAVIKISRAKIWTRKYPNEKCYLEHYQ